MAAKEQPKLWTYLDALSFTKDDTVVMDPQFEAEYKPFVVNRALSYHQDAVLAANMMNERHHLPAQVQFRFYLSSLRPRKRISKWVKYTVSDDVYAIAEYYDCSIRHATELLSLHSPEELQQVYRRLNKGGITKKKGSNHAGTQS